MDEQFIEENSNPVPEVIDAQCEVAPPVSPGAGSATKVCTKCGLEKPVTEFSRSRAVKSGRASSCKVCYRAADKRMRSSRREADLCSRCGNPAEPGKTRCAGCNSKHNAKERRYTISNPDGKRARQTRYKNKNLDAFRARVTSRADERYRTDTHFRLSSVLRARLRAAVKAGFSRLASSVKDLGCSIEEFREYIEDQFLPGMSWSNWGRGPGHWNIDHIVPFAIVDLNNQEVQRKIVHHSNLRPLWFDDNQTRKSPELLRTELVELGLIEDDGSIIFPIDKENPAKDLTCIPENAKYKSGSINPK